MILRRSYPRAAASLALLALAGCLATPAPRRAPVDRLAPDSLSVLREALRQARPGYPTQAEALRAGAYQPSALEAPRPATTPAPGGAVVVQISAHRERDAADAAAAEAERRFPGWLARVESMADVYRVSLGEWGSEAEAGAELARIRAIYPGAWLRRIPPP